MFRMMLLAGVLLAAQGLATPALAYQTRCSDANRASVLDGMSLRIPHGDELAFAERMRQFADHSSMSHGEVASFDGDVWRNRTIIFQSPEVSVAIHVETERGSNTADITIERTCINDALEDWRPYWSEFRAFVAEAFPN